MSIAWKEAYAAMHRDGAADFPAAALLYVLELTRAEARNRGAAVPPGELVAAFRRAARGDFGPLLPRVLEDWGLARPEDLGRAVMLLGRYGCLSLDPGDSVDAFAGDPLPLAEAAV